MFPAWFVSSVTVHRTLRSCRNMQVRTRKPSFISNAVERDCTSWGRALRSPTPLGQSPGESDLPEVSTLECPINHTLVSLKAILPNSIIPQNPLKGFHFFSPHTTQVELKRACWVSNFLKIIIKPAIVSPLMSWEGIAHETKRLSPWTDLRDYAHYMVHVPSFAVNLVKSILTITKFLIFKTEITPLSHEDVKILAVSFGKKKNKGQVPIWMY